MSNPSTAFGLIPILSECKLPIIPAAPAGVVPILINVSQTFSRIELVCIAIIILLYLQYMPIPFYLLRVIH